MPGYATSTGQTLPWGTQVFSAVAQAPTAEAISPEQTPTVSHIINAILAQPPSMQTWTGSVYASSPVSIYNGTTFVAAVAVRTWNGSAFV